MAVPTAPAAGEPIAEAWGDVVHESIVGMDLQAGRANVAVNNAVSGSVTVTFPRPFAATPNVVAVSASTNLAYIALVGAITPTTVVLTLTSKTAGSVFTDTRAIEWIAYGPRA